MDGQTRKNDKKTNGYVEVALSLNMAYTMLNFINDISMLRFGRRADFLRPSDDLVTCYDIIYWYIPYEFIPLKHLYLLHMCVEMNLKESVAWSV